MASRWTAMYQTPEWRALRARHCARTPGASTACSRGTWHALVRRCCARLAPGLANPPEVSMIGLLLVLVAYVVLVQVAFRLQASSDWRL